MLKGMSRVGSIRELVARGATSVFEPAVLGSKGYGSWGFPAMVCGDELYWFKNWLSRGSDIPGVNPEVAEGSQSGAGYELVPEEKSD